jgi:hypothetical protein
LGLSPANRNVLISSQKIPSACEIKRGTDEMKFPEICNLKAVSRICIL